MKSKEVLRKIKMQKQELNLIIKDVISESTRLLWELDEDKNENTERNILDRNDILCNIQCFKDVAKLLK